MEIVEVPGSEGPTTAQLTRQLALIGKRRKRNYLEDSDDNSSDEEDPDALLPPGPLDAEKCMVSGPGFSGGAAGTPVNFFITTKDSRGKRLTEGGAYIEVRVVLKAATGAEEQVAVLVKDNEDGTYTGMYTVPARGNYELIVDINGTPIGGSPFPVFFSPPETKTEAEAQPGDAAAAAAAAPTNSLAATAQLVAQTLQPDMAKLNAASMAAAAMLAPQNSMGGAAHAAGVLFPTDEDVSKRSLLLGNLKSITPEQVKQLFGFCGTVSNVSLVGAARNYALVEYSKPEEATAALAMNGMSVMGAVLKVELAASARAACPQGAPDPFAAMQAHQLALHQLQQGQQESLAAQVAQMRAAAKSFQGLPPPPVVAANSQSQKAAALAAAAALSKRLTGIGGAATSYQPPGSPARRAYSPPRKRSGRARSASPKSRHLRLGRTDNREREAERQKEAAKEREALRFDRKSSGRSRSRDRRHRSRSRSRERRRRSRSRERRRSKSAERRKRSKSAERRSKDRERSSDRRRMDDARDGGSRHARSNSRSCVGSRKPSSARREDAEKSSCSRRKDSDRADGEMPDRKARSDAGEPDGTRKPSSRSGRDADCNRRRSAERDVDRLADGVRRSGEKADRADAKDGEAAAKADETARAFGGEQRADGDAAANGRRDSHRSRKRSDTDAAEASPDRKRSRTASPAANNGRDAKRKDDKREKRKHKHKRRHESKRDGRKDDSKRDAANGAAAAASEQELRKLALERFENGTGSAATSTGAAAIDAEASGKEGATAGPAADDGPSGQPQAASANDAVKPGAEEPTSV